MIVGLSLLRHLLLLIEKIMIKLMMFMMVVMVLVVVVVVMAVVYLQRGWLEDLIMRVWIIIRLLH